MKKFATAAIAASIALVSSPAFADNAVVYNLDASVGSVCGVYRAAGQTVSVPFGDLAATSSSTNLNVSAGSVSYRCNSAAGFTRTISSTNSGKLVRTTSNGDSSNSIPFTISHGGGNGLGFTAASLSTSKVNNFGGSTAFLSGQTGSVNFQVNGVGEVNTNANNAPGTTVFAGKYADTVTIAVTAL